MTLNANNVLSTTESVANVKYDMVLHLINYNDNKTARANGLRMFGDDVCSWLITLIQWIIWIIPWILTIKESLCTDGTHE